MPTVGTRTLLCALALANGAAASDPRSPRPDRTGARAGTRVVPDRVRVPAGPFIQGSTRGEEDERPARTTVLPAFTIDRTEVTREDYARCVGARRCRPAPADRTADAGAGDARQPMANVTWADAQAFCRFAGGRLPSEAEWEKAARGTDGREYPWGSEPLCDHGNWGNYDGEGPCAGRNPGHPVAVGKYPEGASPYGVLDLGGNVWEWVADRYDDDASLVAPEPQPRRARRPSTRAAPPAGHGERRIVRGGSCCSFFVGPRAANRNAWAAEHRDFDLGFRCAADH
jgi:formylglycine-generating enzyme required for sulfatase activity